MAKNYLFFTVLLISIAGQLNAQNAGKATIAGKVMEASTSTPLAYASIRVFNSSDSALVTGAVTNEKGLFSMTTNFGRYYAIIDFIGFKPQYLPVFTLDKSKPSVDLGVVLLASSENALNEVVIQAEKSTMELTLDKRVFNVGKDLSNAGGSASDILGNIPSVSVDQDGNVKLRGSDNVRILVDGKPSGFVSFKGGAGLQQLQGSMIEKVEIITNPSARYEAEGMSGIINIILKKEKREGFNGSFEVVAGQPDNYGLAANVNYRHRKLNFFINYGIGWRDQPGRGSLYQEVYSHDTTFILEQNSESHTKGWSNNIKGGLDFFFNPKNTLTASYLLRRTDFQRLNDITYNDFLFNTGNPTTVTNRNQNEIEDEPNSEYALTWKKTFTRQGHELTADARFLDYWEHSDQTFTQIGSYADGSANEQNTMVQKSLNDEYEKQYLLQLDYVRPVGKDGKVEMGMRSSFRDMINDYGVTGQDQSGSWAPLDSLTNYFIYNENIIAGYGIYGNKIKRFSYQLGLRGEYTDVKTTLRKTNEVHPRNYANLFPSVHLTYQLARQNALQVSYSRRVRRPRYNDLSPFTTFSDNRNYWSGNPDLNPEFTNAFELGHIKYFEKGSFSSSAYYRHTYGKIERIRRVDANGYSSTRPENLVGEDAFGLEFTGQYNLVKWWKVDLNFNFFRSITDGSNINAAYGSDTYSWSARQTSRFSLPKDIDIQVRGNYEAPQQTPQGSREAMYYLDLGANKDVLKGKGTITLSVSDVFNTRRWRNTTEGDNFYARGTYQWRRRQINLTFNYRLNQNKLAGKPSGAGDEG